MKTDEKLVYVPMAADILHPGHVNILKIASQYGKVIVGLFTDEAIKSYKPNPYMDYGQRKIVLESVKYVSEIVPQVSRDYIPNLKKYKPAYMVHGKDWREGPLAEARKNAIKTMAEWGGEVIEPDYTEGVSSSVLKKRVNGN